MSETPVKPPDARPPSPPLDIIAAWPRTAQWALAFLLAVNTLLIAVYSLGSMQVGARPTQEEQEAVRASRIDLNRADRAMLRQLPDVGDSLADRIEKYRRDNGGFRNVDELQKVPGIGTARLNSLRQWVTVDTVGPVDDPSVKPLVVRGVSGKGKKSTAAGAARPRKGQGLNGPVDVNRATEEELQQLPGIGPTLARRIVAARQAAPFRSVEDLRRVRGIGAKTLENLRPYITVGKSKDAV